jgi:hypothetical protein
MFCPYQAESGTTRREVPKCASANCTTNTREAIEEIRRILREHTGVRGHGGGSRCGKNLSLRACS